MDGGLTTDSDDARLTICNTALTNLNAKPIPVFTGNVPGTNEQNLCALHYDKAFQIVLGEANWSFALSPTELVEVPAVQIQPGAGLNGWGYMYHDYSYFLKVISVYPKIQSQQAHYQNINKRTYSQQDFTIQDRALKSGLSSQTHHGSVILTDIKDAMALVITANANVARTPHIFRECIIYKLSSLLALPILGSRTPMTLITQFELRYDDLIKKAWIQDLPNHYTPERRDSKLISSRF